MAKEAGLSHLFYLHGNDLSGDTAEIVLCASPRGVLNATGISAAGMERILGKIEGEISWSAFFNDVATVGSHPILSALPTTDVIALWALGQAQGDAAASLVVKQVNYDPSNDQDGNLLFGVQCLGNLTPVEWLELFSVGEDTQSSSGNTASKDDAASTADGFVGVLEMRELEGTSVVVTWEDSPDDSVWSTLKAHTSISNGSEPTAERVTVTGTVNRYLRLAFTGTFTDADYVAAYRRGDANEIAGLIT